jgi:hypothetical protein
MSQMLTTTTKNSRGATCVWANGLVRCDWLPISISNDFGLPLGLCSAFRAALIVLIVFPVYRLSFWHGPRPNATFRNRCPIRLERACHI